jgi:protein O-GlcNAc transferase
MAEEFNQANLLLQRGEVRAAASAYRKLLARDPGHAAANHLLGVIELQCGRPGDAVTFIAKAIEADANDAHAHLNLGAAYMALGRADDALRSFDRALQGNDKWALARTNRGNALRDLGRREEALVEYQRALALKPDYALALRNCGRLLHELKNPAEALACYERALQLSPGDTAALVASGNILIALSRPGEAVTQFDKALALDPNIAEALNNRGLAQLQLGDAAAALECFDRLLRMSPQVPGFWANRGEALRRLNRFGEAAAAYSRLCDLAPDFDFGAGKLFNVRQMACEWSSFAALTAELERRVADGKRVCAPFEFLAVSDSAAAQLQCAQLYAAKLGVPARPSAQPRPTTGSGEKIRLAYVSGDFANRPVAHLLVGVLERHDREKFETIGISLRPADSSDIGRRIARSFDRFIDISSKSDREVSELMAELDVHIAIDLMGHTHGSRPAIFSNRAAPIQVAYLGFPGTSGSACMDYIMADDFLIPEETRSGYAEHVVYLPECFQPNDDLRRIGAAPTRRQMGLPDAAFVFCSFNNSYKLNPAMFDIWCRLLLARPDSVLWLVADVPEVKTNLRREARQRDVDGARIIFANRVPYQEHLGRQRLADLFLDTLPFNAGTTASDALWAGLPVLTCVGGAFAARMAGSLLRTAGLPELITYSLEEYEMRALQLSAGGSELEALRERLVAESRNGPLFGTARFSRILEAAYREMWRRRRLGFEPASFKIPANHDA